MVPPYARATHIQLDPAVCEGELRSISPVNMIAMQIKLFPKLKKLKYRFIIHSVINIYRLNELNIKLYFSLEQIINKIRGKVTVKKLLIILAIIFSLILPAGVFSQSFNHSYLKYSSLLSSDVYPSIQNYVKELNIQQAFNQHDAQIIIRNVSKIIILSLKQKNLIILSPSVINIVKLSDPEQSNVRNHPCVF